jgi:hypothetical protein
MITITDKEKQYLLSVDAVAFVEGLYSKSIFYELVQKDEVVHFDGKDKLVKGLFYNITLVGLYNLIVNIIDSNIQKALNLRHCVVTNEKIVELKGNDVITFSIIPRNDLWQFNLNKHFQKDYDYIFTKKVPSLVNYPPYVILNDCQYVIKDTLLLKEALPIKHVLNFYIQNINEFISKMLILYNDFVDNIPV